ncbi:SDR family NAD(P)-dependent oxidoreductase [Sphingomonas colocasiae]|uniref:SDR family NAD(P)-dependent oxidoreductase n=1 Tax=Sphingomonas colocasiae TaxID=1848973 RepID=A0ABS7PQL2_9SPHN|nr:SDR family NAD(P)-dependent oxidoreductase [Sphingomonas colocasiae]MBY8823536.1 SDR family NAD(P)-dependent oxidoreductase [Sphingomonas colocasiae]
MAAGRTAVVTGAASGIGAALALHAAAKGMAVAACDRDAAGLERLAASLDRAGARHIVRCLDVTDADAMSAFADDVAGLPPIALLFANAGILRAGDMLTMPPAEWRLLFDVNVIGVVVTLQAFVPRMIVQDEPAQLVVTGSTGSMVAAPGLAAYCATKHALWPMVEALQGELADTSVGASLLMPGAVATRIFDTADPDRAAPAESISPEDAAAIAFDGAVAGRAKILTHPRYVERARQRFATVLEELAGD